MHILQKQPHSDVWKRYSFPENEAINLLHVNVRLGDVHTIKKCGIGCEFHAEVSAPSFIGLAFKKIVQNIHVKNSIKYKSIF